MNGALAQSLRDNLPNLLGAISILVGGVLVAWIIPRLQTAVGLVALVYTMVTGDCTVTQES